MRQKSKFSSYAIVISVLVLIYTLACNKSAPVVPPIPPGGGGGGGPVVVMPDTTIPAPGAKVRWFFEVPIAPLGNGTVKIVNSLTGKMLHVDSDAEGFSISQLAENGSDNQKWTLTANANGNYTITNVFSNKAVKAKNCGSTTIDSAQQITATGSTCEQWKIVRTSSIQFRIYNQATGKSLAVAGRSLEDSAKIVVKNYIGSGDDEWELRAIPADATVQAAYNLITASMNKAVKRYNKWGNFDKTIRVSYVPSVPTADANFDGSIRFGANPAHQGESTALHELAHCMGVGTSPRWSSPLVVGNKFVGAKALQWVKYYDGANAIINCDNFHFWPYGINFSNEFSEGNADRHVRLVWAMKLDGL